ncbi:hypothetical protein ACFLSF_01420 [Candidatus Bipolaricaulota bacterium]
MEPYLVDELIVEGSRIVTRAHPRFRSKHLTDDFFVQYEDDVSLDALDESILIIPFLLNVLPLVWISGETYRIRSLDAELAAALDGIRRTFRTLYPGISWQGELIPDETVTHPPADESDEIALLFSGGADSAYSSLMHRETPQLLITILSALGVADWRSDAARASARAHFRAFASRHGHRNRFVTSNLCEFIAARKLVGVWPRPRRWLLDVQYGLGFASLAAPLLHEAGPRELRLASCESDYFRFPGGAHSDVIHSIRWSGVKVLGDGVEKRRQQKLHAIHTMMPRETGEPLILKPCLGPVGQFENCCACAKCLQTIVGLIAEGANPQTYGFAREPRLVFSTLRKKLSSYRFDLRGIAELLEWLDIQVAIHELIANPRWADVCRTAGEAELRWLAGFDLVRYFTRYHSRFRQCIRYVRWRVGRLIDLWPAFGRLVRRLLR